MTARGHRPGVGKNGEPGIRVQVILPPETLRDLEEWRGEEGAGPAVRRIVVNFFAKGKDST